MTARPLVRQAMSVLALLAAITAPVAAQSKGKSAQGSAQGAKPARHAAAPRAKPAAKPAVKPAAKPASKRVAKSSGSAPAKVKALPPGQAKKRVTHTEAVDVTRRVLVERGYTVTRVERRGDTRVIYYYRGNNGRGKGHGPLQKMVVRPSRERFVFDGAPAEVLKQVTMRLQM